MRMIIYEFSEWGAWRNNGLFTIREIEVEEKLKTYLGKHTRINKSDIDVMQRSCGCRMYRLDNDPMPYIEAMIKVRSNLIENLEKSLATEKAVLAKWEALKENNNDTDGTP